MGRRPPALGGASAKIPMQPVQVINAPGTLATWARGGLLQVHQPKAFRDGPSKDGQCMGTSKQGDGEQPRSWLADKQNLWEAQLPNSSVSPLPWVPQL